jgi:GTP-binding protein HflX
LVEAFRSTLEEASDADLIVHVVDASHPDPAGQIRTVRDVLGEAGAREVPEQIVFNKTDLVDDNTILLLRGLEPSGIFVSARTGAGVDELLKTIAERIPAPDVEIELLVPYNRGDVVSSLHLRGVVLATDYEEEGTRVRARITEADKPAFVEFLAR